MTSEGSRGLGDQPMVFGGKPLTLRGGAGRLIL